MASSYLGLTGIGAAYLSLGTLMSAMTKSQLVALLLTIFLEFGLFIMGVGEYIFDPGVFRDLCAHVSMMGQMGGLLQGHPRFAPRRVRRHGHGARAVRDHPGGGLLAVGMNRARETGAAGERARSIALVSGLRGTRRAGRGTVGR